MVTLFSVMSRTAGGGILKTGSLTLRFRNVFLLTTVIAGGFLILTSNKNFNIISIGADIRTSWESHRYDIISSKERFTIKTDGCSIPAMKPEDKSIKKFVEYPSTMIPCPNSTTALLDHDQNKIWVKNYNRQYYNITDEDELLCCYQSFYRPESIEDIESSSIDNRAKYDDCVHFNNSIEVRDEYVRVTCNVDNDTIYEQYFLFAIKKEFTKHDNKGEIAGENTSYNVLILGIDAVSRLNFHRTMPKTISYLKSRGAVELMGYNKVGDNTFPNLIPMLMGLKDTELKKTCLPHSEATFDNCPFVWEWFKQAGYYTALGEDSSYLGTFNYFKVGFIKTPTDYYLHTFIHEAEHHVGMNKDFNSYLCMNERHFYKVLLDYITDLTVVLKNKRMFGFFWEVTMSHDYLNYPMTMDEDYLNFFEGLETSLYLEDTIVLLVSDHGIRWGEIRSTKQGRLEERLPFVFLLTPPSFRKDYRDAYNNLKLNGNRLTSPFDVHATLTDLVNLENVKNDAISLRSKKSYANDRSISLFLPIPGNRTCEMAGIEDHWCTCHRSVSLSKDSSDSLEVASNLVILINSLLVEYPQCAQLSLTAVLDVTELEVGEPSKDEEGWREFMVVVRTTPGRGVFEATLRHYSHGWELAGTPSRLNLYGDQSRCVDNYQMKLFCYCN